MPSRLHDAVIVGAGPAGLATALAAARAGLDVRVIDARRPPIDKACGEGLMPDGVAVLDSLGVSVPRERSAAFRGVRWIDRERVVEGTFPAGCGLGVRRTVLHRALVEAAERAGIEVAWGLAARGIENGKVLTSEASIGGRWIIGADGLCSRVRRWAGLERAPAPRARFGRRQHFARAPWTDHVEVWWDDEGEAYVTPLSADEVGVALLSHGAAARFADLPRRFPELAARLAGAEPLGSTRGAGPLERRVRAVHVGCVALVGDAAGYVDAITGEGLALAFRQAVALVDAIAHDAPAAYAAAHRRIVRLPEAMTRLLLAVERRPALRRAAFATLSADADLFSRILAVHARERPVRHPGLRAVIGPTPAGRGAARSGTSPAVGPPGARSWPVRSRRSAP
jgi:flavin-dependent dehydrogenase